MNEEANLTLMSEQVAAMSTIEKVVLDIIKRNPSEFSKTATGLVRKNTSESIPEIRLFVFCHKYVLVVEILNSLLSLPLNTKVTIESCIANSKPSYGLNISMEL